ncbi:flavodoxin [Limosilactobacillus ingluviei]|uniref:flavodoxin n=1 Tax=Limosilactobacillus ingluviei TaxID=148604 RepID=UPI0006870023|nr:flavodoxin [Limosilactobacillus ingluviei]
MNRPGSTLIVYFSLTQTTKRAAQTLQKVTGARQVVALQPQTPYPQGYDNYVRRADDERLNHYLPALRHNLPDLAAYQTIWVGFPTWWHQPPMLIHTFFQDYDLRGKVIIPFTTSMSDPISKSMSTMADLAHQAGARLAEGLRVTNQASVAKFVAAHRLAPQGA